jgi:ABC-type branched-subunit amino acid transport system substrate-binding protein
MRQYFLAKWTGRISIAIVSILLTVHVAYAQVQPVFRIGVLGDADGPMNKGAQLAVQEINKGGGAQGADGTLFRLELILQPTDDGANLTNAINNLRGASVIAVLGPETNQEVADGLQALEALTVPVLTPATGDTLLTSASSGLIFRSRAQQVLQGRALANYFVNNAKLQHVATVQLALDIDTTAEAIGFTTASSAFGVTPQPILQVQGNQNLAQVATQLIQANPQAIVVFGDPARAGQLYKTLRASNWIGQFAYNRVDDKAFLDTVPTSQLPGMVSTTTWPFTATDADSTTFRDLYVRTYAQIPGPVDAAAYDSIYLLKEAIRRPGELRTNLAALSNIPGVQGPLSPAQLGRGEISNNVAVIQIGQYGAPEVLSRLVGSQQVAINQPVSTSTPTPTATPDGVVATVNRAVQNVRSGPSTNFDKIGELKQNDQVRIIGANADFTWLVISFRGQQGWIAANIVDIFGDLNTVPFITPPASPTPPPSPTVQLPNNIVIDAASVAPTPIIVGQPFTVNVTVRNAGGTAAGQFAIAATFPPNNIFASAIVPGLAAGQSTNAVLTGTFTNTGFYSVVIVADLNKQVGPVSNTFTLSYAINKPILRQGTITLNPGTNFDLEGTGLPDIYWNANSTTINAVAPAQIGIIPNITLNTVHWDLLTGSIVNQPNIKRVDGLNEGTLVGILTADGNRGVFRIDGYPNNSQLQITYIVYKN